MSKVLETPKLIEAIVSKMETCERLGLLLVNRMWFHACLPYSWEVIGLVTALSPLGKIVLLPEGFYFAEPPSPEKWERFRIYSKHVRVLGGSLINKNAGLLKALWPSTIESLFPNVRCLGWRECHMEGPTSYIGLLISPSLHVVTLLLEDPSKAFVKSFCNALTQLRALKILQVEVKNPSKEVAECNDSFNQVLKTSASTLKRVHISDIFYTHETIQFLGNIPNLVELEIGTRCYVCYADENIMTKGCAERDISRNFGSLQCLSFKGSQQSLCDGFLSKSPTFNLVELNWHILEFTNLDPFVKTIVNACPQLENLTIDNPFITWRGESPIVSWTTIQPVLECRYLTTLSLRCCQIEMTAQDWTELLTSRHSPAGMWKELQIFGNPPLAISDITLFAEHCPGLKHLGINILDPRRQDHGETQTQSPPNPEVQLSPVPLNVGFKFSCLNYIRFAKSDLSTEAALEIATLLDELCDLGKTPVYAGGGDVEFYRAINNLLHQLHEERRDMYWNGTEE